MTTAPDNIKTVRALLLECLDMHDSGEYPSDLDPDEVGIVGDSAHRGGYHCGSDRVDLDDYSVRESSRDRNGLTLYASAMDVGSFSVRVNGVTHNLRTFSVWLVGECARGAADCADFREIIYSPDGQTVKRWDKLGIRSSGDSSHLWHTHISFFRDASKAGRDLTGVFRRYLTAIGLVPGSTPDPIPTPTPAPAPTPTPTLHLGARVLRKGMKGNDVAELQTWLRKRGRMVTVDGDFGTKTDAAVRNFQTARWLVADGEVGPLTVAALKTNLGVRTLKRGMTGADVGELQRLLNRHGAKLAVDNDFGPRTYDAVRAFQRAHSLSVDGEAGPKTVTALRK